MGYSHDIFKFLEMTANVTFLCNGCLNGDILPKSTVSELSLSKGIEDIKESLEIIKSRPTCNPSPPQLEGGFSSVVKSTSDISQEVRFSGMPEVSMGTDSKIDKWNIFEHDEKMISKAMKLLGANAEEISSFRRLGKFNSSNKRPRKILVKFRNFITADRLFARATIWKNYKPNIKGNKYSALLSKSLNEEDQERKRNLLEKKRELLESGNEAKDIKTRNKILYPKNRAVNCSQSLPNKTGELGALYYNVRNLFKLEKRQSFSNSIILKNFDIICLSETWLAKKTANPRSCSEITTVFYQTEDLRCNQHLTVEH